MFLFITLLTILTLTLVNPFTIGLATSPRNSQPYAQFDELLAQDLYLDAQFTASVTEGDGPLTVEFDATTSNAPEGTTYEWWFGEGGRAKGKQVTYTYEKIGEFAAILILKDGDKQVTATQIITVKGEGPLHTRQLEFVINTDEVRKGFEINGSGFVYFDSATTIPVRDFDADRGTYIDLLDKDYFSIASDMIFPGFKETIVLNSGNTIRTNVIQIVRAAAIPEEHVLEIYKIIDQHPQFSEAVELLNTTKGLSSSLTEAGSQLSLIEKIGLEVTKQYLINQGIDPEIYFGPEEDSQSG